MKKIIIILVVVALLVGCGFFIYRIKNKNLTSVTSSQATTTLQVLTYSNQTYNYKFNYPSTYAIKEYSPQNITVGSPVGVSDTGEKTLDSLVDLDVVSAGRSDTFPVSISNFDDFVKYKISISCDADGYDKSVSCPQITRTEPFVTDSKMTGSKIYFKKVVTSYQYSDDESEDPVSTTQSSEVGPVYVFNISANHPNNIYTALIISNRLAAESISNEELNLAVDSFTIPLSKISGGSIIKRDHEVSFYMVENFSIMSRRCRLLKGFEMNVSMP